MTEGGEWGESHVTLTIHWLKKLLGHLPRAAAPPTYLHHFCNKGKEIARRFLIRRSLRPPTGQSRACSPTSPSGGPCLRPRPQAVCRGSSPVRASACPCGSPSGIGVSLFAPCCGGGQTRRGERRIRRRWRRRPESREKLSAEADNGVSRLQLARLATD